MFPMWTGFLIPPPWLTVVCFEGMLLSGSRHCFFGISVYFSVYICFAWSVSPALFSLAPASRIFFLPCLFLTVLICFVLGTGIQASWCKKQSEKKNLFFYEGIKAKCEEEWTQIVGLLKNVPTGCAAFSFVLVITFMEGHHSYIGGSFSQGVVVYTIFPAHSRQR